MAEYSMKLAKYGRERIYTDESAITIDNVRKVVADAMTIHEVNAQDIKKLFDIERGKVGLSRKKDIRPEVNIEAYTSLPSQIVDFKIGYEHGHPISYTQRAKVDAHNPSGEIVEVEKDDLRIVTLNEMMREVKKSSKDIKLARYIKICGVGYRYITPSRNRHLTAPFGILILNPLRTFIIYTNDAYSEPIAAVTYTERVNSKEKKFGVWTRENYFEFDTKDSKQGIKVSRNSIGLIPIIEYDNNDDIMGSFEKQLPLIDAYNITTSDRVNDIAQQVQSILWLHNTKLSDEQKDKLVDGGVIQTQANADGKDAKIQYVSAPLQQADVQTLSQHLKDEILESAGVPKLSETENSTGEASKIANGWHSAETQARTSELIWRESEDATIEVCLQFVKESNTTICDVNDLELSDIDYTMHRSENYDIVSRVNSFATLVNLGCDITKSAMYCRITDDPLQFAKDSEEGINSKRFSEKTDFEDKTVESIQPDFVEI